MKKLIFVLALCGCLSACTTQTALVNGNGGVLKEEEAQTFYIGGVGQTQVIDAAAVCGGAQNVVKVERVESASNIFLRILTLGIYTPQSAKVYCTK